MKSRIKSEILTMTEKMQFLYIFFYLITLVRLLCWQCKGHLARLHTHTHTHVRSGVCKVSSVEGMRADVGAKPNQNASILAGLSCF